MKKKGFTLVELLVVIAILALLMSIVIVTINPAEILRKTRDTKRVSDLSSLRTAMNLYLTDKAVPSLATTPITDCASKIYYSDSVATTTISQVGGDGCTRITAVAATSTSRLTDGTGWIPVNFNSISSGSPLSSLPVDPTNAAPTAATSTSNLYYTYACNATSTYFEVNAQMESAYYKNLGDGDVVSKDGGNCATLYEVGNAPGLYLMGSSTTGFY